MPVVVCIGSVGLGIDILIVLPKFLNCGARTDRILVGPPVNT